jgi:hypothetical protein
MTMFLSLIVLLLAFSIACHSRRRRFHRHMIYEHRSRELFDRLTQERPHDG